MSIAQRIQEMRTGFTPTFWVANTLELFERLAFYGSKAVLTVYLAMKVGLHEEAGTLAGLFSGLIFSLPIVAGVFVDRYGFRRTLLACFAMFSLGYFAIGLAGLEFGEQIVNAVGKKTYVIGALLLTAMGGSLIKPCIVGTIAKTSKPGVKSLGFAIYYTLVNVGGAVGPILAMQVRENLGIEYVLVMSSLTSFLLFLGALIFFREPESDEEVTEKRTFGKVFKDMLLVFRNIRFISFLVIFSGFWIMFWQIFYTFPFYVIDVLKFPKFEILITVNAWTIIFMSVLIASLTRKWRPMTAMTLGFTFASFCWILIGVSPTVLAAIIGIGLFAIGEATQAPRFYEYVGSLAPKEQVGTFMGFAFLPVAVGSFAAGPIADWLRHSYLTEPMNPSMMWYTLATMGIISTLLMLLYDWFFVRRHAIKKAS